MRRYLFITALLAAALPGCALHHVSSDTDAVRFAKAWETPRLAQQIIELDFKTQGDCDFNRLFGDARNALLDSGKFRPARKGEKPTIRIEITVRVRRETHVFKTVCNALILYAWPIDAQDYVCEVFVVARKPSGEPIGRTYTQGRGRGELWLGYVLWPRWVWNDEKADVIHRDAIRAATVKLCRTLMPEAKK
jgi:hypothetical protein